MQRLRESKVESAEIVSAESVSTVREHSGESTKSRVQRVRGHRVERREHSVRIQSRECRGESTELRVQRNQEYRVESAEIVRAQSRE